MQGIEHRTLAYQGYAVPMQSVAHSCVTVDLQNPHMYDGSMMTYAVFRAS